MNQKNKILLLTLLIFISCGQKKEEAQKQAPNKEDDVLEILQKHIDKSEKQRQKSQVFLLANKYSTTENKVENILTIGSNHIRKETELAEEIKHISKTENIPLTTISSILIDYYTLQQICTTNDEKKSLEQQAEPLAPEYEEYE